MRIIDIHIHGFMGINFNDATKNEVKEVLKNLYNRGYVGVCPTLVGDCTQNIQRQLNIFKEIKEEQLQKCDKEALLIGAHLEGTFLNPHKSGIQNAKNFLVPTVENFRELCAEFENIVKIVTLAPELDAGLGKYLKEKNIKVQAGHTLATKKGEAQGTTHHFNAMPPIAHRGENLALDALFDNELYCEIIADLVHVSENMLKMFLNTKNKDKVIFVSDALPAAGADREIIFCNKKIFKDGKDEFGTLAGSVMTLDEIIDKILEKKLATKEQVAKFVFSNPLEHLNLSTKEIEILKN